MSTVKGKMLKAGIFIATGGKKWPVLKKQVEKRRGGWLSAHGVKCWSSQVRLFCRTAIECNIHYNSDFLYSSCFGIQCWNLNQNLYEYANKKLPKHTKLRDCVLIFFFVCLGFFIFQHCVWWFAQASVSQRVTYCGFKFSLEQNISFLLSSVCDYLQEWDSIYYLLPVRELSAAVG